MAIDEAKLQAFMGKMLGDMGAAMGAALVLVGDKLGLYRAMAGAGPISSADLAQRTATDERYVREWLAAQAAAGYLDYAAESGRYSMNPEQELVFAAEGSPVFVPGAFEVIASVMRATSQKSQRPSKPAAASAGMSMTRSSSRAPSVSSAQGTTHICSPSGFRHSTECVTN
jgi:hypothetical protein